jgi:hypothetical protein
MKTFAWGLGGLALGTLLILVPMVAVGRGNSSQYAVAPMMMSAGMGSMSGAVAATPSGALAAHELSIVHVQRGCHDWSTQGHMAAAMSLRLHHGDMLTIMNSDVDGHMLMQQAGPQVLMHHARMMMNARSWVRFDRPGLYRFTTRTFGMANMPEVKTIGPDHHLALTVRVV